LERRNDVHFSSPFIGGFSGRVGSIVLSYLPMPARKPRPKDEKPQFERFLETVRKVEAGETDEELERALEKIAPPKPVDILNEPIPHADKASSKISAKAPVSKK
jgi:hypothetical protein